MQYEQHITLHPDSHQQGGNGSAGVTRQRYFKCSVQSCRNLQSGTSLLGSELFLGVLVQSVREPGAVPSPLEEVEIPKSIVTKEPAATTATFQNRAGRWGWNLPGCDRVQQCCSRYHAGLTRKRQPSLSG